MLLAAATAASTTGSGSTGSASTGSGSTTSGTAASGATSAAGTSAQRSAGGSTLSVAGAQVALDRAERALASAELDLRAATMRAPMAGVVSALPFTAGGAASASDTATIIGSGAIKVTIEVPEASYADVAVGQKARVTQPGASAAEGHVASVALLPTDGATTYAVSVISGAGEADGFAHGATASVSITTSSDEGGSTVVVPVSAVTRDAAGASVRRLVDGAVETARVTLGSVGDTTAAVREGVAAGDELVISDSTTALPTAGTGRTRSALGGLTGTSTRGQPLR